jgi:hypothetical protein
MAARSTLLASAAGVSLVALAIASCGGGTEPGTDTTTPAVASAAASTVSVSAPSIASGSTVTVTLQARTAAGANITAGGATVALSLAGSGTSDGTLTAVTDNGNGSYTATFTGTTAGTARSLSATLNGVAVTTPMPTITVTPGPASTSQSTIETSASSVGVGGAVTLTVRARDAAGNAHTSGGLTVTFTKGAGTSDGTIGAVTDAANGTYTATFTATTAGTARSIGATINGNAITSVSPTITVTTAPPSPATSTVTLSGATVASGSNLTITLQAKDAAGTNITTGGATVAFALAGVGTSTGTISAVTDNNNGTYTASLTGVLTGTARAVSATLNGAAVTTTQPTFIVNPGSASTATSMVSISVGSVAVGGAATLMLTAKDAAGNSLSSGGLTVAFTKGAGTSDGSIGAVTDQGNGTYTATFTASTAGTARSIGATIGGTAVTTAAPQLTVTAAVISPAMSTVSVASASVQSGSTTTITLQTKDGSGANITSGGATVAFALGTGTSTGTISSVTDNNNGTYTATLTAVLVGTARTITATVNGSAVTSSLPTITVTPGPASTSTSIVSVSTSTVTTGAAVTLTLTAKDAAGNSLTTGGLTVAFTKGSGTSDGTIGAVTDNANGTYTATFTSTAAGTARAIGATIGGSAVTSTAPTITVVAPVPSAATSTVSVGAGSVPSGTNTTVTLQAKDGAGVNITSGGATVTFSLASGTSTGTLGSVTDNNNGTYTATFTGVLVGTARSIAATVNGDNVTTAQPTITVTPGAISPAQSVVSVSSSYVEVAGAGTLTLTAKDAAGNSLTTGGSTIAFTTTAGANPSTGTIGSVTDNNNGTYTATFTGTAAGTELQIGATIGGAAVSTAKPGLTVYTKGITLSTDSVPVVVTSGQNGTQHFVGVFANGGQQAALQTPVVTYTTPGIAACQSSNWLGTPSYDFTTANPVSIVSFTPNATSLLVYTCTATVTINSTTPGITSKTFKVVLAVARGTVAATAVNLVAMGNANNNVVQSIAPSARVTITNGGRGVVTGVKAMLLNVNGVGASGDPDDWLKLTDLSFEPAVADTTQRTLPTTLVVTTNVKPFSASATVRITGTGMPDLDIPVNILFNIEPEVVTQSRGLTFTAFAGGPSKTDSVVAFNQNRTLNDSLFGYQEDAAVFNPHASWLTGITFTALNNAGGRDTASKVRVTINPANLLADSIYTDTIGVRAKKCVFVASNPCDQTGNDFRPTYKLPIKVVVERGLVLSASDVTMFAATGTTTVTRDITISNGGATVVSGLAANVGGAGWLSASFVGGTAAPTTLRLTANPTGLARGSVQSTTVTVSASTPTGVPNKTFTVTFRVY